MKTDSPFFDRIRVKPEQDRLRKPTCPQCQWPGCDQPGTHRAPKGRMQEGQYWLYCLDHVKEYNQSYNYFAGMSDSAVYAYQKDALTGHRPTWRMGTRGANDTPGGDGMRDPFGFTAEMGSHGAGFAPSEPEGRAIRTAERQALEIMGLELSATGPEIKARFKELVKKHHPDANGGDKSAEERLRNVIQAHSTLKKAGFC
ncbi:heat shock protein [Azorhizobium caulinodans ORS 571]|uniref:Heat shock protein n=1 Tax=Azorhizobium caulinodans (strain ATCC 43989 / DSM 5975 / JCM 20966 / LMG 6465 / NBRC 14845 / NCIMB 13405 / ORS 571) TaxID=438753 RepID=A8IMY3_AZOC5|nr:J domain-containing protein [Azorhizobium caulinodans]BAF89676.1 heat shock protein [Azorhizobium caulinodans ORS 571]